MPLCARTGLVASGHLPASFGHITVSTKLICVAKMFISEKKSHLSFRKSLGFLRVRWTVLNLMLLLFCLQFRKGNVRHNSTHRIDFKNWHSSRPDVILRRKAQLQNEGLGKENLFYHHGNRYSNNMISWYDEQFNKREREGPNKLPELRQWDSHRLAWLPEKSDHPIQGMRSILLH